MHNPTTTNKKTNINSFKYALTYIITIFLKTKTKHNNSTHRKTYKSLIQSLSSHQSLILNK